MNYQQFIESKSQLGGMSGFDPVWMPDFLFDFQKHLVEWACRKGKAAIFADCGLGKTPMQLVWAENVIRKSNLPVLILTPLAVSQQTHGEADKFGIETEISRDGNFSKKIVITNYERLHHFDWQKFGGMVCDESSILKNFDGVTKQLVTEFMRKLPYRLLCTATAAPNDYIELGTSSEALGELGYIDMLKMFFKADNNSYAQGGNGGGGMKRFDKNPFGGKFRFRGHAERQFWRWVCSWARAIRKPSDLGFDDDIFILTPLNTRQHIVKARTKPEDFLFDLPATNLAEQRSECRRTINERCEMAAQLSSAMDYSVAWCNLNQEGDLLTKLIPGAVQVSGGDAIEHKEEALEAFRTGKISKLVTKPDIAGFGSNWQHCAHQTFFPSHSYEQWYQAIRRCWRFGQKREVIIDMITTEGLNCVLKNIQRKAANAETMFSRLVELMSNELTVKTETQYNKQESIPVWL